MIRRAAVDAFLNRDRRDFSIYKRFSLKLLQERIGLLPARPPIWKRLRKEQRVGFLAGVETKKFCFWYDMGMGKTLMAVALSRYFRRIKKVRRVLVLVPNKINKHEWAIDIKKHSPNSTYTILSGSSKSKWLDFEAEPTLFVLETYGGFVRMMCQSVMVKRRGKPPIPKLKPHKPTVNRFMKQIQGIVMDESIMVMHKKGRYGSLGHRLCKHIAQRSEMAYAMNGTPFGDDPTDMWGQFKIIDQGETLGETLGLFRAAFFNEKPSYWGGSDYTFDKKKEKLLNRIITNRSIRYEAPESTLPKVTMIVKPVSLPEGADEYYEKAKQEIIASKGNFQELKNAFVRMRQIASGFVGYNDDELGERARYEFTPNPKLEQTISLVQGIVGAHKVVVFHEFTFSGDILEREVKALGVKYARLYGKTKDPNKQLTSFHDDPKCRVFILQNAAGGFGLDRLKVARYAIYHESPLGTVLRQQTIRRVRRQGSEYARVIIYDVIARGTVDQQILDAHEAGINLFKSIINGQFKIT